MMTKDVLVFLYIIFGINYKPLLWATKNIRLYFTLIPLLPGEIVRARKTTRFNVSRSPKRAYISMSFSVNCILNRTLNTPG